MHKQILLYSTILTIVLNIVCYLLSSREIVCDFKNTIIILVLTTLGFIISYRYYKKWKASLIILVYALFAFIVPYIAYITEPMYLTRLMKDFLSIYTIGVIFLTIPIVFAKYNSKLICFINGVVSVLGLLPMFIVSGYYYIANAKISADTIMAILQTNRKEAIEFINSYFMLTDFVLLAIFLIGLFSVGYYATGCLLNNFPKREINMVFICCLLPVLIVSEILFLQKTYLFRSYQSAKYYINTSKNFKIYENRRMAKFGVNGNASAKWNGNYALVIGETHVKSHMGIAGYSRDTTPWLSAMMNSDKALILENSYACAAQTEPALRYALTQKNQYNSIIYEEALTIVEMAKLAGFKVVWISNQTNDTIAGLMCEQADESIWLNQSKNDNYMHQKNGIDDGMVVKYLSKRKEEDKKTLYIIHLLGSHADYSCRYPDQFNKWDDNKSKVNAYDNSILFNDYVMENLTKKLFVDLNVEALMYFSDHGEELKNYFCHGTDFYLNNIKKSESVKDIMRIPVFFIFSEEYRLKHADIVRTLQGNKSRYYTNDMVFDTLFGLMGVESNYINKQFDITSSQYKMELDNLTTSWGKVKLRDTL